MVGDFGVLTDDDFERWPPDTSISKLGSDTTLVWNVYDHDVRDASVDDKDDILASMEMRFLTWI